MNGLVILLLVAIAIIVLLFWILFLSLKKNPDTIHVNKAIQNLKKAGIEIPRI